jgi:putative Holliday junction resolvase
VRVLAIDFGSKRIGLAVGDSEFGIPSPRAPLESKKGLPANLPAILETIHKEEAQKVVIGVPIQGDGSESDMTKVCRQMARLIREAGIDVIEMDEALTSVAAEERLREHDWTAAQRDRHKDSEAACLILERFFAEHG